MQLSQSIPLKWDCLYNGVGGSLLGQVPYGILTFGSYEMYKHQLPSKLPPILKYTLSAILGDITGSWWLCPSEVIKQQLQAGIHPTILSAIQHTWYNKGWNGFYVGYGSSVVRDVPFRVMQLASYELVKNLYLNKKQNDELSSVDAAICGAISGSFSAAITNPLDRMKTLVMTDGTVYGNSVGACAGKIWKDQGWRGFCQGVVPRVTYVAPSVTIFFMVYEQVMQQFQ